MISYFIRELNVANALSTWLDFLIACVWYKEGSIVQ